MADKKKAAKDQEEPVPNQTDNGPRDTSEQADIRVNPQVPNTDSETAKAEQ